MLRLEFANLVSKMPSLKDITESGLIHIEIDRKFAKYVNKLPEDLIIQMCIGKIEQKVSEEGKQYRMCITNLDAYKCAYDKYKQINENPAQAVEATVVPAPAPLQVDLEIPRSPYSPTLFNNPEYVPDDFPMTEEDLIEQEEIKNGWYRPLTN